jgi:hypothetical protein
MWWFNRYILSNLAGTLHFCHQTHLMNAFLLGTKNIEIDGSQH